MRHWVVVPALLTLLAAPPGVEAKQRIASSRELLEAGFFEDFEELDLEALLVANDVRLSIAGRREDTLDEAPGVVAVVTAEDLRATGAHTLVEALQVVPGVEVVSDGLGRPRVVIRGVASGATGGGSENILILMDGRPIEDPVLGGATIVNPALPVGNISRIEVLRGAASSLYGSGAVSGVINILTFTPEEYQGMEATVEAGSFATQRYALRLGSEAGALKTFGFLQFEDTNGARRNVPRDSMTAFGVSLAPAGAPEGFRSIETNYRATWKEWEAALRIANVRADGFVGLTDALARQNDLSYRQIQASLDWKRAIENAGTLRVTAMWKQNQINHFLQPLPPGFRVPTPDGGQAVFNDGVAISENLNSRRYGVDASLDRRQNKHRLVAGLGLARESAYDLDSQSNYDFDTGLPLTAPHPTSLGPDQARSLFFVFGQDIFAATDKISLTGSLRFDHFSDVGGMLSPRAAAVFTLPRDMHLKLIYGRGFRAPTFAELDYRVPVLNNNPHLDSVRADTIEAAVSYRRRALRVAASGYTTWLRDPIAPAGAFDPRRSRPAENAPGSDLRGFELEVRRGIGAGNSIFVNYAYQHAELQGSSRELPGVPAQLGNIGATFALGHHWRATPLLSFRTERPRAVGDLRPKTAGYGLFGVTIRGLKLYRTLSLALSAQNLFDKDYADPTIPGGVPGDYPRAGRRVLISATYEF